MAKVLVGKNILAKIRCYMTTAVKELLNTFDALTDTEKHEAATQLLRRVIIGELGDVTEDVLVFASEELFLELDAREATGGQS